MRIEPPWSPPMAMSTSPAATTAALPDDDPPAEYPGRRGFCTGPAALVWLPPEKQKYSPCTLPTMVPPASSMRARSSRRRRARSLPAWRRVHHGQERLGHEPRPYAGPRVRVVRSTTEYLDLVERDADHWLACSRRGQPLGPAREKYQTALPSNRPADP